VADVPGLDGADVYFGDPDAPLPNWRDDPARSEPPDDDEELTDDEREALTGMLGVDTEELFADDEADEPETDDET